MAKTRPQRPASKPQPDKARSYARWGAYAVAGVVVVGILALMLNTPEEVPDEVPDGVEAVAIGDAGHVEGAIAYDRLPPAGGPHNEIALRCGIYEDPVPNENAVHALEHGAVWITYQPDIGSGAINTLENASRLRSKTILSPFPGQASPVIVSAWGWQMPVEDAGDVRIRQFVEQFESARTAPEPNAAC